MESLPALNDDNPIRSTFQQVGHLTQSRAEHIRESDVSPAAYELSIRVAVSLTLETFSLAHSLAAPPLQSYVPSGVHSPRSLASPSLASLSGGAKAAQS